MSRCKLEKFISYEQPAKYIVDSDQYDDSYETPVLTAGKSFILGYTDEKNNIFDNLPVIIFDDFTTSVQFVDFPFKVKSSAMKLLKNTEQADIKYCYYLLKFLQHTPENHKRQWLSATSQNIVELPTIEKQKNIVRKLDKILEVIDNQNKQLELLDEAIKARFVEMFGDPIENQKDWEVVKIRDIVTDVRYGTSKPAVEGGRYPYLRMNNLTVDGGLDLSDLKYIDIPNNEIEKCVVRKGDILFNRTNSIDLIGKTAVFNLLDDMVIAGYIIRIRLNNQILPDVFSQYMNLEAMKKVLRGMAKGAVNQANINAQELQSIKVYVPDMKLQKQYVEFKEEVDKSRLRELLAIKQIKLLLHDSWFLFY